MRIWTTLIVLFVIIIFYACNGGNNSADNSNPKKDSTSDYINIGVHDIQNLISTKEKLSILDVRTSEEVANGKIEGARVIDFYDDNFEAKLNRLNKETPYLVYCKSGGRSAKASKKMKSMGFKHVYNLKGGYNAYADLNNK